MVVDPRDEYTRLLVQLDHERSVVEASLHSELERLHALRKLGSLVNATFNLEQILRFIVNSLVKDLEFDTGLVYLSLDQVLQLRSWAGFEVEERGTWGPRLAGLIRARVEETELPWLIELGDQSLRPELRDLLEQTGLQSLVIAPVWSGVELVAGIVAARLPGGAPVTAHDMEFFRLLAPQTGLAVMNARMYRKVEAYSKNLEQQVSERMRELTGAYRDLQASKEQLVQSEKMAFLGQLTAGIAHEMNTPIGAVANCLKSLGELATELEASVGSPEVTADDYREILAEMRQSLSVAGSALTKAAGFVRSLKAQTRDLANVEVRDFDPVGSLRDIELLLQHELRKTRCVLSADIDDKVQRLRGDAGKFSQILTNLINNAMDAYDGREPGLVLVRLRMDGSALCLEVSDQGCGISAANQQRLFREMFTTKWQGKGTGLGLSIVHGIVTGHFKGQIEVESAEDSGTTFKLRLPGSD